MLYDTKITFGEFADRLKKKDTQYYDHKVWVPTQIYGYSIVYVLCM